MIEKELRSYYAELSTDLAGAERVLEQVLNQPRPSTNGLRNGLAVAGGVAAVAAIAVAATQLSASRQPAVHADAGSSPVDPAAGPSYVASVARSAAVARAAVTPQVTTQTLIDLLKGSGSATNPTGRGLDNQSLGEVLFNDGHGIAKIDVVVTWPGTQPHDAVAGGCGTPSATCVWLNDGTQVGISQSLERPDQPATSATMWSVSAYRGDGLQVDISEWNAAQEKDSPVTRATPPLSIAQLTTLATDPRWSNQASAADIAKAAHLFTPDTMPGSDTPGVQATPTETS